jgi:predicted MFS family arabinose efflux permease
MLGPILGGAIVDTLNIKILFVVLIGLLFIAIIFTFFYEKLAKKHASLHSETIAS